MKACPHKSHPASTYCTLSAEGLWFLTSGSDEQHGCLYINVMHKWRCAHILQKQKLVGTGSGVQMINYFHIPSHHDSCKKRRNLAVSVTSRRTAQCKSTTVCNSLVIGDSNSWTHMWLWCCCVLMYSMCHTVAAQIFKLNLTVGSKWIGQQRSICAPVFPVSIPWDG